MHHATTCTRITLQLVRALHRSIGSPLRSRYVMLMVSNKNPDCKISVLHSTVQYKQRCLATMKMLLACRTVRYNTPPSTSTIPSVMHRGHPLSAFHFHASSPQLFPPPPPKQSKRNFSPSSTPLSPAPPPPLPSSPRQRVAPCQSQPSLHNLS